MKIVSHTTDTISVRECHQSQHEITTPENSTMTSTVTPEKLPWSQNSSSITSFRTELCSSEASAILEQRQPLNKTKTTILKPPKPSDNPKMKTIQRKKKTERSRICFRNSDNRITVSQLSKPQPQPQYNSRQP